MPVKRLKYSDAPKQNNMAMGTVLPTKTRRASDYLDNVRDFNRTESWDIKKTISLCRKLYMFGGAVSTAIDILTEFPVTDFSIENVNSKPCLNILNYVKEHINQDNPNTMPGLKRVNRQAAHDYFLCGNSFLYEVWEEGVDDPSYKIKGKNLPTKISNLNPSIMDVPEKYVTLGQRLIFMELDKNITAILRKRGRKSEEEKAILAMLPDSILEQAKNPRWNGKVLIDNEFITQLRRKGQEYDAWGIPYLTKAFSAAASLQRLRLLDDATIEGLINYITIFRIGDPDNPATWSQDRLNTFANMMRDPAASNYVVWPYDIDVITTGPDGKILDMSDKYQQVNYDILGALGIPKILFTGEGSTEGVKEAISALLERLEIFREDLQTYLETLLRNICIQNGYKNEFPKIRWSRVKMRDDHAIKQLTLTLFDRGLIPYQVVIAEFGYDYETFKKMRQQEIKDGVEDIFVLPNMPFSTPGGNSDGPPKKNDKNDDKKKSDPKSENGRPPKEKNDSDAEISIQTVRNLVHARLDAIKTDVEKSIEEGRFLGDIESASIAGTAFIKAYHDIDNGISTIVTAAKHMTEDVRYDHEGRDLRLELKELIMRTRDDCITRIVVSTRKFSLEEISEEVYIDELDVLIAANKAGLDGAIQRLQEFESDISKRVNDYLHGGQDE